MYVPRILTFIFSDTVRVNSFCHSHILSKLQFEDKIWISIHVFAVWVCSVEKGSVENNCTSSKETVFYFIFEILLMSCKEHNPYNKGYFLL